MLKSPSTSLEKTGSRAAILAVIGMCLLSSGAKANESKDEIYGDPEWSLDSLEDLLKEHPDYFKFVESVRGVQMEKRERLIDTFLGKDVDELSRSEYDLYLNRLWLVEFDSAKKELDNIGGPEIEVIYQSAFRNGRGKVITMKNDSGKERQIEVRIPVSRTEHRITDYDESVVITYSNQKYSTLLDAMSRARDDLALEI